jgi:hypothetical protein
MAFLASVALSGAVPASRHKLTGTAEALAILGCGLLAVDLYGARALGSIPATADGLTYAGLSCALVAVINLLMSRLAPKVVTFGLAAVVVGQLPLTLGAVRSGGSGVVAPRSAGAGRGHLALDNEGHQNSTDHRRGVRSSCLRHDPHHRLRPDLRGPAGPLLEGSCGRPRQCFRNHHGFAPAGAVRHWSRRLGCGDRPSPTTQGIPPDHFAACAG